MCSPELTRGMCCICFGALTLETVLFDDLGEGRGGVHRGKCAILAGVGLTDEQRVIIDDIIRTAHRLEPNSTERDCMTRAYYAYVDAIAEYDFYDNGGPE